MNSFEFLQQLDGISPEYIEESLGTEIKHSASVLQSLSPDGDTETVLPAAQPVIRQKRNILRTAVSYVSLAACVMLAVGAAFLFRNLHDDRNLLESDTFNSSETSLPTVTATVPRTDDVFRTETASSAAQTTETQTSTTVSAASVTADSLAVTVLSEETSLPEITDTTAETTVITETEESVTETDAPDPPETTETTADTEPPAETESTLTTTETESQPESTTTSAAPVLHLSCGDLDGDGLVTEADIAILYCITARERVNGVRFVSDERYQAADLNKDGNVTYADQILMSRYIGLFWYGGYRDLSIEDYLADEEHYAQIYRDAALSEKFGDLWTQAALVLNVNESGISSTSNLTYETRSPESEEALQIVRDEYNKML